MIAAQHIVVCWIEFAVAGTILFCLTRLVVYRLHEPVDRVNVITMSLFASATVPLALALSSAPSLNLGLLRIDTDYDAEPQLESRSIGMRHLLEASEDPAASTETIETFDAFARPQDNSPYPLAKSSKSAANSSLETAPTGTISTPRQANGWSYAAALLVLSHCVAFVWIAFRWIIGVVRLGFLTRNSRVADDAIVKIWKQVSDGRRRKVQLLVTKEISAPLVFNTWQPVILIPESVAADEPSLRFCLAHESSHLNGGDLLRWQLVNLFQFVFWYQPLFWMLRRELQVCQDLVADDQASEQSDNRLSRVQYSELLLSIAKEARNPNSAGAIAFYVRTSQLARRINALLIKRQSLSTRSKQSFLWMHGLLLLVASLSVGSVRIGAVQAQERTSKTSSPTKTEDASTTALTHEQVDKTAGNKIVRGHIVDQAGEPVAGAKLWLPLLREPRRVVEATADDTGKFELDCPADWISPSSRGSFWTAWVYAPGFSVQSQSVYKVVRGENKQEYTIELPPACSTRFRVLDPSGQPLVGVLVKPQNYKTSVAWEAVPEEMQAAVSAHTDKNGWATLPAIEPEPLFRLELVSDKFGRQTLRVDDKKNETEREIRLQTVASINGRLLSENVAWAQNVKLAFTTDSRDEWNQPQGAAETVTGEDGSFQIPVIANGGPLRSYVLVDPTLPVRPVLSDNIFLTAGETVEIEIPLVPAPEIYGKVVAKSTGNPVAGAEISLGYGGFRQSDSATTDENGVYRGRALPGDVRVHIISLPNGYVQLGSPWAEPYQVPENVDSFELPTIEVVGSHLISGQLIDAMDRPLPNLQIQAVDGNRRYGFGKSDAEGRFKMTVPDGVDTKFQVSSKDHGSVAGEVVQDDPLVVRYVPDLREKEMETERALKPDVSLLGRVLMSDKPVADIPIVLKRGIPVGRNGTRYSQVSETRTDRNGNYRLDGLKAGDRYHIEVRPTFPAADPRWHYQSPYIQDLPETAKGEVSLPDVKLLKLNQSIAGVVVDSNGNPVKDATISVNLRSGQSLSRYATSSQPPWTKSDHLGRFRFKGLPDDKLSIMAYFANPESGGQIRFPAKRNVNMNQQDIRIVLDPSLREEQGR